MPPSFCSCFSCSERSSRSNAPFFIRAAIFRAFSASSLERRLLDQADHVAHAEDAPGNPLGMEILETVELLAGADELDRLAGDRAH